MPLTNQQKKYFRQIGHDLQPVVTVAGNGLSEGVLTELERALTDHELIKVKLVCEERSEKAALIDAMCEQCKAELVNRIGHIALIYRAAENPNPKLSNLVKHKPS